MHLVLILHALGPGGTERQVTYLAAGLVARGERVTVVEIRHGAHFVDAVRDAGAEVVSARARTRANLVRVIRAVRDINADVAYGLNPEANVLALASGAPAVFGVRGTRMDQIPADTLARTAMALQHRLAGRARLTVANSEAAAIELRALGYPAGRLRVVHNAIEPERFVAPAAAGARLRARLGVSPGDQLVATVARMDRQKDHETFLRAAALGKRPGRRFAWFGEGPLRARIEVMARHLGVDLIAPGATLDVAAVYAAADVFTLTSAWGEAFSNAFAEALAAGRPCVVTASGDHAMAAAVATVVAPRDPAALAAGWDQAVAGDGPGWVRRNLGLDQMVSSTHDLLLEARRGT